MQVLPNGNLVFPPFRAEDYRQEVHAQVYSCLARSPAGSVHSRDVNVRAGKWLSSSPLEVAAGSHRTVAWPSVTFLIETMKRKCVRDWSNHDIKEKKKERKRLAVVEEQATRERKIAKKKKNNQVFLLLFLSNIFLLSDSLSSILFFEIFYLILIKKLNGKTMARRERLARQRDTLKKFSFQLFRTANERRIRTFGSIPCNTYRDTYTHGEQNIISGNYPVSLRATRAKISAGIPFITTSNRCRRRCCCYRYSKPLAGLSATPSISLSLFDLSREKFVHGWYDTILIDPVTSHDPLARDISRDMKYSK